MTFGTWAGTPSSYTRLVNTEDAVSKLLRWISWLTWLAVGLPVAVGFASNPHSLVTLNSLVWTLAFITFGPALATSSTPNDKPAMRGSRLVALFVATLSPLVMIALKPECFAGALLVVVAWQSTLQLTTAAAIIWVGTQSVLLSVVLMSINPDISGASSSIIFSVFQFFAFSTAYVTRHEIRARQELVRSSAELKATQLLLAQSSRIGERVRISRELHDVLGHDLTALSLHLEIARNSREQIHEEVGRAQVLAKGLLGKVREVVSLMRANDQASIVPLLHSLAADGPQLKVHLTVSGDLDAADAGRTHTLLRCLQEIITNARLHSGARNLWLDIGRSGNSIVAHARDDGHGAISTPKFGNGLTGMRERLEEFGGGVVVTALPKTGFKQIGRAHV